MSEMPKPHLVSLAHLGRGQWEVRCLACTWSVTERNKRDAIEAGHLHWLARPVVSGVFMGSR